MEQKVKQERDNQKNAKKTSSFSLANVARPLCRELGANLTGWSCFLQEIGRGFWCGSRTSFQSRSRVAYSGGGRRLSGGDGLRRDGAGREVGRQGRREVPSVECRFEPQLHHSLAASHFCISRSACMAGDTVMNGKLWHRARHLATAG